jgi:hypothetical protein
MFFERIHMNFNEFFNRANLFNALFSGVSFLSMMFFINPPEF